MKGLLDNESGNNFDDRVLGSIKIKFKVKKINYN